MPALAEHMRMGAAFWTLAAVALLVSHDAVFLVQLGPGESLAHTLRQAGHDYWGAATVALGVAGTVLAAAATWRLVSLRRRATALQARLRHVSARTYLVRSVTMAARLFAVVAAGFVLQENVEHILGHGHAPGLGALLGPEYPLALPVIAGISLIAGLVGGVVATTERLLVACIAGALARRSRHPRHIARLRSGSAARPRSPMASRLAGRAPPLVAVAF